MEGLRGRYRGDREGIGGGYGVGIGRVLGRRRGCLRGKALGRGQWGEGKGGRHFLYIERDLGGGVGGWRMCGGEGGEISSAIKKGGLREGGTWKGVEGSSA